MIITDITGRICFETKFDGNEATQTKRIDAATAKTMASQFIKEHERLPQGYELMSFLEMSEDPKDPSSFEPWAKRAIERDSMRPRPILYYALAKSLHGDLDTAIVLSQRALTLDPRWTEAWGFYLSLLERQDPAKLTRSNIDILRQSLLAAIDGGPTGRNTTAERIKLAQSMLVNVNALSQRIEQTRRDTTAITR